MNGEYIQHVGVMPEKETKPCLPRRLSSTRTTTSSLDEENCLFQDDSKQEMQRKSDKRLMYGQRERVDTEGLYATLCAASSMTAELELKTKHKKPSFLRKLFGVAKKKKENFLRGNVEGLPKGWGVGVTQETHWSRVSCMLFHEPIRMDLRTIQAFLKARRGISINAAVSIRCLNGWMCRFEEHIKLTIKLKDMAQEERITSGFKYRVNTEFDEFWTLLGSLKELLSSTVWKLQHDDIGEKAMLYSDAVMDEVCQRMENMCKELDVCLIHEEELLSSLLSDHFDEQEEHEAIMEAINRFKVPSESIIVYKIVHAMHNWLGIEGRTIFLSCLSMPIRWSLYSIAAKEYHIYMEQFKSIYAQGQAFDSSSKSDRFDGIILTPREDPTNQSNYAAMML